MCGITYIVTVCDADPLAAGRRNVMTYRFPLARKARSFAEDAMSRGFWVVMHTEDRGAQHQLWEPYEEVAE